MRANWIAVASAEHARRGRDACTDGQSGFMQVNHGKRAPLMRVHPGDRVACYAPSVTMGGGFVPFRRDMHYLQANEAPIAPLLDDFEFVEDRQRWGYKFRFGLFSISDHDMLLIAQAMQAPCHLLYLK